MNKHVKLLLSMPKTVCLNLKLFGFRKGLNCPVWIGYNVVVKEIHRNSIIIPDNSRCGTVKIGINHGSDGINENSSKGYLKIAKNAQVKIEGKADFKEGISIIVSQKGKLSIGKNFSCNRNCFISSDHLIEIGEDAMFGWNVHIRTSDGHPIYNLQDMSHRINNNKTVKIGSHVWIASNVDILKGAGVPDNCIVGFRSCVTHSFTETNCVIVGCPAKVVKRNITWSRS